VLAFCVEPKTRDIPISTPLSAELPQGWARSPAGEFLQKKKQEGAGRQGGEALRSFFGGNSELATEDTDLNLRH